MIVEHAETALCDHKAEMRYGIASWDDGSETSYSFKYAVRGANGRVTRTGEVPVECLRQALDMGIRHGYVSLFA